MSVFRHEWTRFALVLLVALAARGAFVLVWHHSHDPTEFEFPDSAGYWDLGHDLAAGEPYEIEGRRILRAPGYPMVLAALFKTVGPDASPAAARWWGAIIGTLTVGVVYWLARTIFGPRVALLAGLLVAVYPENIATSVFPLSDGPFCLWMMLQLGLWQMATTGTTPRPLIMATLVGAVGGVATLTRPSWLLYSPLLAITHVVATRFERRQLVVAVTVLAGFVVVMMPWWVRSYNITGRFVPTVLWVGPSLYDGLNPAADGGSNMDFVPRFESQLKAADATHPPTESAPPYEYRFDRMMRDEALRWAAANPGRTLQLAGIKLLRMWNVWPNEPAFRSWPVRLALAGTYIPLMLLAIYGGWLIRGRSNDLWLLVSPAIYFSLIHAVFVGSLRYRQPAMLPLAILAAVALDALISRITQPATASRPA